MDEKRYKLRYLPLFRQDLSEILSYIAFTLQNPAAAEELLNSVEAAIMDRSTCAEAFEVTKARKSVPIYIIASM